MSRFYHFSPVYRVLINQLSNTPISKTSTFFKYAESRLSDGSYKYGELQFLKGVIFKWLLETLMDASVHTAWHFITNYNSKIVNPIFFGTPCTFPTFNTGKIYFQKWQVASTISPNFKRNWNTLRASKALWYPNQTK